MLDTNILLAGIIWRRFPHEVLMNALNGNFILVLAPCILVETEHKFLEKFPQYAAPFTHLMAHMPYELAADPSPAEITANHDLMIDQYDIPLALAAINAQVDYFVSEDKNFTLRAPANQSLHDQLNIRLSGTFLREVMGYTSPQLELIRHREQRAAKFDAIRKIQANIKGKFTEEEAMSLALEAQQAVRREQSEKR